MYDNFVLWSTDDEAWGFGGQVGAVQAQTTMSQSWHILHPIYRRKQQLLCCRHFVNYPKPEFVTVEFVHCLEIDFFPLISLLYKTNTG